MIIAIVVDARRAKSKTRPKPGKEYKRNEAKEVSKSWTGQAPMPAGHDPSFAESGCEMEIESFYGSDKGELQSYFAKY